MTFSSLHKQPTDFLLVGKRKSGRVIEAEEIYDMSMIS